MALSKATLRNFHFSQNTYSRDVNGNPKDKIQIEIGDSKQPDFKPQAKIMRWDNEVNFSLRAEEHPEAVIETIDNIIKYKTPEYEVHQYELNPGDIGEDGGLEFEWVLHKKPSSNVLSATIQSKGLNFYYQPALTQEEIDQGSKRPENVVGSYAVYHQTKGGMNDAAGMDYKTGKAFHIYRPKVTDAAGKEIWGELHIDQEAGILTVTIDQKFLDEALYPVIVDPTFGYTSIGVTTTSAGNSLRAQHGTPPIGGSITSASIYLYSQNSSYYVVAGIYDASYDQVGSETLETNQLDGDGWTEMSFASSVSVTNNRHIVTVNPERIGVTSYPEMPFDSGDISEKGYGLTAYPYTGTLPASISSLTNTSSFYSIYATYTAATIVQEGFAFGDDDNNESTHSLDTQDTNITAELGTKTLRLILDTSNAYSSSAYKLKYQKNGSGGYTDVPTSATYGGDDLVIDSGDTTNDSYNTTTTNIDITLPAFSSGDLVIISYSLWNNSGTPTVTWANGPNGETVTDIVNGYGASGNDGLQLCIGYFIATANYAGGDMANDSTNSTRWAGAITVVPAGEFDADTPIGAKGGGANSASDVTDITFAGFSAGSTDGGGKLLVVSGADQDPFNATMPSGYTLLETVDGGRGVILLATRDTNITNSETIATAVFDLNGAGADAMAVYGFIVRTAPPVNNEVYISTSSNVAAGGEDTTARLTAPSGKTTGDFDTGRRWDDENGSDSVIVTQDEYTELEWILTTQSPATTNDYFEFRIYAGDTAIDTYTVTPKWTVAVNTPPTVVLNSPADEATSVSTTPTFEFTGTDTYFDDDVRYNIQIDDSSNFGTESIALDNFWHDEGSATSSTKSITVASGSNKALIVLITGYDTTLPAGAASSVAFNTSESFTHITGSDADNGDAQFVDAWYLVNPTSTTANVVVTWGESKNYSVSIWSLTGVHQSSPIGNITEYGETSGEETKNISITTTAANSWVLEVCGLGGTTTPRLSAVDGQTERLDTNGGTTDYDTASYDVLVPSAGATNVRIIDDLNDGDWSQSLAVEVKVAASTSPLIDAVSGTDAGFSNTTDGADTDPFDSGDKADYDVQAGDTLDPSTTYYWRVRAKDPSGTDTYGSWSSTRSFTTGAAGSEENASVSPVGLTLTVPAVTATYAAVYSASVSPISLTATLPVVTATYASVLSASVSPVGLLLSIPSVTATHVVVLTASVSPISLTATIPSVTATYAEVDNASVVPAALTLSIPSVVATYVQVETASVSPIGLTISIPAITATYVEAYNASVSPISLTVSTPGVTATYAAVVSASVTPILLNATVTAVTATYASVLSASVSPVVLTITIPEVTAVKVQVGEASVSPLTLSLALPSVTATYAEVDTASVSPISLALAIPSLSATYVYENTASVSPISLTLTPVDVTASYAQVNNAQVSPISLLLTLPEITADYVGTSEFNASVSPMLLQLSIPSVSPYAMVNEFPQKLIFVDGKPAWKITSKHYTKI